MQKAIAPKELIQWLPGQVLTCSGGLGWKDVEQRSYRYKDEDVFLPPIDHYMIVGYRGGHTSMDRCVDDSWKRTHCAPGDISLLTKTQASHWHWKEGIDVSHVYLSSALMSRVAIDVLERSIEDVRLHDLLKVQDTVISSIVSEITKETTSRRMGCSLYVESLGVQLAIHLLRQYASVSFKVRETSGQLSQSQKKRLLEFISANLQGSLRLHEMANAVGLGEWAFTKKFNESFHCSPHIFVTEQRIERAKHMLTKETLAIKEIAYLCGFSDQAHLTRVLHAKLGITPKKLREAENNTISASHSD